MLTLQLSSPPIPTSATRRASYKRRKLESFTSNTVSSSAAQHSASSQESTDPVATPRPATCSACHRAFRGLFAHAVICSRCKLPVCSICSRICLGWPSSIALPTTPTPTTFAQGGITRSHPMKRIPFNATQTNADGDASVVGKRRKLPSHDEDATESRDVDDSKSDLMAGCSRPVCPNCCYECPSSEAYLCYDCCDRLQPATEDELWTSTDVVQMVVT